MKALKRLRDDYVIWHANNINFPEFDSSNVVRKKVIFSGRVQKVGFRLELFTLSKRLKLTGWVKNLEDGSVVAELQGEETKVDFLIKSMKSLKRASVKKCDVINIPISRDREDFIIVR
ncbi:acylphosphatase [Cytobacillus dafuensis]|uniref:acylphosphatase n=1 Tax=Cytobacillus dafuensis TaxID=1742359 RepID=A0A5B8Z9H1_CYTDA|nr:acylphosphatase [Cytobacillus dafuensis]QED48106.1 acylphosphatase [Cytobacillus dafuensis]